MAKMIVGAAKEFSWSENKEIRLEAIKAAVQVYHGKGDYLVNEYAILNLAKSFELFVKGER